MNQEVSGFNYALLNVLMLAKGHRSPATSTWPITLVYLIYEQILSHKNDFLFPSNV